MIASSSVYEVDAQDESALERRFGGLRRLYGAAGYQRLRQARVAVVGLGGVGSWAAEALARSGVAALVLIDMDHVAESNINRQVQALESTLGMAKGEALRQRIADIHPGCAVTIVDEFVSAENWPALLPHGVHALIDACDQVSAKQALAQWGQQQLVREPGYIHLVCGAAGGKRQAHGLQVADLAEATHDPLLAALRQRLRKAGGAPGKGAFGLRCVYSREAVAAPQQASDNDGSLNCHGYGSSVAVTAAFGMAAAGEVMRVLALGSGQALRTEC